MALRNFAVSVTGPVVEQASSAAALTTAVSDAIDAAATANAISGSNADVTTELDAITTALAALTADVPTGGLVITINTSTVTTKNQLRALLDTFFKQVASTSLLS